MADSLNTNLAGSVLARILTLRHGVEMIGIALATGVVECLQKLNL